jgi:DNA-binding beta-propeller fold protein YncE
MIVGRWCANGNARAGILAVFFALLPAAHAGAQTIVARVPIPPYAAANVAVNPRLNKIYLSGGASARPEVYVVDGRTFKAKRIGTGSGVSVDTETGNYWAANASGARAIVRKGLDNNEIYRVSTTEGCPLSTTFDNRTRRVWVANQCGKNGDPVFVFDGDNFGRIAGPIPTGGVMSTAVVSPATGRLYIAPSGISKRIDPETFQVTGNAFGIVRAVDPVTGKLFALSGQTLQLINGIHDPETVSVAINLGYVPAGIAVDFTLGHIYLSNPAQSSIEIRMISTGALLNTFTLPGKLIPGSIAVDTTRGRVYLSATHGPDTLLLAIDNSDMP